MSQLTTITLLPQTLAVTTGEKMPAACYYVSGKNLQTLNWKLTAFLGTVVVQATLVDNPTVDTDWFTIYNLVCTEINGNGGTTQNPKTGYQNVLGNFAWIRANVTVYNSGTVEYIKVTY